MTEIKVKVDNSQAVAAFDELIEKLERMVELANEFKASFKTVKVDSEKK